MLKQRREAATLVATDFLKAEKAIDDTAHLTATCLSTMLQVRSAAGLPIDTGIEALDLMSELALDAVRLRQRFVSAHRALANVRDEIGLARMYGDEIPCPTGTLVAAPTRPHLAVAA